MGICSQKQSKSSDLLRCIPSKTSFSTSGYDRANTEQQIVVGNVLIHKPNKKLLLDFYANEGSKMPRNIKKYYEIIFSAEELEITEIDLKYLKFSINITYQIKNILNLFQNVKVLNLSHTHVTSNDLKRIYKSIGSLAFLEVLDLECNQLDSATGDHLSHIFSVIFCIKKVNLRQNKLGSDGVVSMCKSLQHLESLENLNLEDNLIEDAGILVLLKTVKGMQKISHLGLSKNPFSSEIAREIINIIDYLPDLKSLTLENCKINLTQLMVIESKFKKREN